MAPDVYLNRSSRKLSVQLNAAPRLFSNRTPQHSLTQTLGAYLLLLWVPVQSLDRSALLASTWPDTIAGRVGQILSLNRYGA